MKRELTVAKRLITRICNDYVYFIDVVCYDALARNSSMVNHLIDNKLDFVIKVKKNNNNSIKEIKSIVNKTDVVDSWYEKDTLIDSYDEEFYMNNVEKKLRFVKFTRKHSDGRRSQELLITSCLNMNIRTIYKIVKAKCLLKIEYLII